ncbi:hypothetical protein [Patulibacter sp.]|uniref:hypothetical protein n=1 Tax=Patulibacter sp. TaxID=1912859 RepID=UPI00271B5E11|nr:hypothetical protein [Patulibacter sp.]MDO9408906.1 hypothetical protein [Patulibacter sp.]
MSRAWQEPAPQERVVDPRPGALLGAAGAIPLGIAVLVAAGLLPAGLRIVVGVAVVVLGARLLQQDGTALGARATPAVVRAVGLAAIVVGAVLTAGAVAVGLSDVLTDASVADRFESDGTLAGGTAALASVLVLVAGAVLLGVRPDRAGGRLARLRDPGEDAGPGRGRTLGALVAGVGAALAVPVLLGGDVVGLADGPRVVVVLLLAAAATASGLRVAGRDDDAGRGLLVAAGVLVALTGGEATQLLASLVGPLADPTLGALVSSGARGARTAVAAAIAVVLLVVALRRRDAVVGVLPLGVLLLVAQVEGTGEKIGALLVPVVVLVLVAAALGGARRPSDLGSRDTLLAAAGAAALLLAAQAGGVLAGTRTDGSDVVVVSMLAGVLGLLVVLAVVAAARRVPGRTGAAFAVVALVALVAVSPLNALQSAGPESWGGSIPVALVVWLGALALTGAVLQRRRDPLVLGAAVLVVATSTSQFAFLLAFRGGLDDGDLSLVLAIQVGTPVLLLLAAAVVALLGPAAHVGRAQAAGAGAAYVAGLAAVGAAQLLRQFTAATPEGRVLEGGPLVVVVLLLLLLAVGTAVLAAGTARRPSVVVAVAAVGGTLAAAVLLVAVGPAAADGRGPAQDAVPRAPGSAADLALGVRAVAGASREVGAGWPILFGVLGAVLLGAAWVLESRRPVPPGAPLG